MKKNLRGAKYLVAGEVGSVGSQDSGEAVLLKEHLREPFLDGGEVEKRLSEDQGCGVGLDVEALLAEDIVPDGLLVIPIHQVAFLRWQQVEQRREVSAVVHLVPNEGAPDSVSIRNLLSFLFLPLLRLCLHDAVRHRPRLRLSRKPRLQLKTFYNF